MLFGKHKILNYSEDIEQPLMSILIVYVYTYSKLLDKNGKQTCISTKNIKHG